MFLCTKNYYQFRMTPFYAKIMVVGCFTAEINHTGYVSAGGYKKFNFDFLNGGKFHNDLQEALPNVKFTMWV